MLPRFQEHAGCVCPDSHMQGRDPIMTAFEGRWLPPPKNRTLSCDEVHVWYARLDRNGADVQSFERILSADERDRAQRFRFDRDRQHFIVARGVLRLILSSYLGLEPSQLRFCYGPHGKPGLVTPSTQKTLSFNTSHCGELALYAITRERKIGIDVERVRTDFAYEQIAERFFSPREKVMLDALQAEQVKRKAFFDCWTRKEAYIKARGEGLSLPLDRFDVSLAPGEPATLLEMRGEPLETSRWSLHELFPGPGYAAALAVEGHGVRLACWEWREQWHTSENIRNCTDSVRTRILM
jgi:4'-phosphopantetheinyl transferase